jgi:hypothetical protein
MLTRMAGIILGVLVLAFLARRFWARDAGEGPSVPDPPNRSGANNPVDWSSAAGEPLGDDTPPK